MCLGVPVKIEEKEGKSGIGEIGGVKREVDLRFFLQLSAVTKKSFDLWTEWLIKEVEKR